VSRLQNSVVLFVLLIGLANPCHEHYTTPPHSILIFQNFTRPEATLHVLGSVLSLVVVSCDINTALSDSSIPLRSHSLRSKLLQSFEALVCDRRSTSFLTSMMR
jgi:hypothetical protein